ncbi:Lactose transport system permease protein LacF [subsurface metagenome]
MTSYNVLNPPQFIGIDNYRVLFTDDPLFWKALYNTFYYAIFAIPLAILIGVSIALLLNLKVKGMPIYRTVYYLPAIVPVVGASIVWMWFLNPQYGVINGILDKIGISGPGWITDPKWSKPSLIIMSLWAIGGAILIYLAGLQDVPQSLYESAELDGANRVQKTIHITIPMITPSIFFNFIMGLIGAFQYFTQAYIMTDGGPADSTLFYSLYLYNNAFGYFKMGYASAMAWILFLIILACTLLVFKSSAKWVYYERT